MASPSPSATAGKMLGRYQVLKPLAQGGMAEVLLARAIGIKGFERHVVIKRIRVDHDEGQRSIDMFLDEARLVASLHHRNIVQVHDVGFADGKYFFAMEYVHGEDARTLLRLIKEKNEQIPLEHVLTVITGAAAGLHHAHELKNADWKPLNIVHRDISPGNILIGFDGSVKVVDFGIAKAEVRSVDTQAGAVKGKVGYMSPEQCKQQPLDRRTDIYLLGIVLYEMLTVRRLFKSISRYESMASIVAGDFPPPSKHRKDLPKQLEAIVMKALAPDPAQRYQTAEEMRLALEKFAEAGGLSTSPSRLSDYIKGKFGERPEPWLVDAPIPAPKFDFEDALTPLPKDGPSDTPAAPSKSAAEIPRLPSEPAQNGDNPPSGMTPMAWVAEERGSAARRAWILGGLGILAIVGVVGVAFVMTMASGDDQTEPAKRPPVTEPDQPVAQPDQPVAQPDKPVAQPDKPVAQPDKPVGDTPPEDHAASAPTDAGVDEVATAPADAAVEASAVKPVHPGRPGRPGRPGPRGGRPAHPGGKGGTTATATAPGDKPPGDKPPGDKPPGDKPPGDKPDDLDSPFPK